VRKGQESIRKTKDSKGRGEVSDRQELYNRYILAATSLDESAKAARITGLYRKRWQIELVFKRLKSLFHYNGIPVKAESMVRAWFYDKLLPAALCERIVNTGRFSPSGG
jgi:IS4 transposase